jgi:hypothetical protein
MDDQVMSDVALGLSPAVLEARYAAELWGVSEDAALAQLEANFEALFRVRP